MQEKYPLEKKAQGIEKEIAEALGINKKNVRYRGLSINADHEHFIIYADDRDRLLIDKFSSIVLYKYPISFLRCDFDCEIYETLNDTLCSEYFFPSFSDCTFFKEVIFEKNSSYLSLNMSNCFFASGLAIRANFKNNAHFSKCYFEKLCLSESSFEKDVSFYGSTFKYCPNFAQCCFKGSVNLVNTNLSFDFEDTENQIKLASKDNKKHLIANDFRDSFRLFKNALSKEGNIIDASNHHRIELYCKEIELDSKPEKTWRDWIDWAQLFFYRHTSDHHTDLLRIISWVIATIGCFGLGLFACRYGLDFHSFATNHSRNAFATLFDTPLMTQSKIMGLVYLFGVCSLFWQWSRILFFSGITLSVILVSYKNIFGINTLLNANISQNPLENLIVALYLLLMFLLLFSLQKTARKNSIIPS